MKMLRQIMAHPLTKGLDIDDPGTTALRREIIRTKPFLMRCYQEWYDLAIASLPDMPGRVVEIGSGAGFFRERLPGLITSDVFVAPGVDLVFDARQMPFPDASLRAVVMFNVFHHVPDVSAMLREAARALAPGGRIVMIEPWVTPWSRLIYTRLHHEPFSETAREWTFTGTGPLSSANGALPWIVFRRDAKLFAERFPDLKCVSIRPFMPLRYLLSGGVSMRSLSPAWSFGFWRGLERLLPAGCFGMFAHVVVERR
jgi:SAM-dependent methyltransferase